MRFQKLPSEEQVEKDLRRWRGFIQDLSPEKRKKSTKGLLHLCPTGKRLFYAYADNPLILDTARDFYAHIGLVDIDGTCGMCQQGFLKHLEELIP